MQEQDIRSRVLRTEKFEWRKAKWLQNDNLKELAPEDQAKLKASLLKNGFVMAFNVWDDGQTHWILDGHHRQKALKEMEAEGTTIPELLDGTFIECADKQEAAKLVLIYSSAYARMTQTGLFDFINLHNLEYEALRAEVDFPDFSLDRFEQKFDLYGLNSDPESDPADHTDVDPATDDADMEYIVQPGDLFALGDHRLICADFNAEGTAELLMDGEKARILLTDPPYNLKTSFFKSDDSAIKNNDFQQAAGEMTDQEFVQFLANVMKKARTHTVDGAIHYLYMDFRHCWHMLEAARIAYAQDHDPAHIMERVLKQLCVWNKTTGANGSFYRSKHELVFIFKSGTAPHLSHLDLMDRTRYNVWDYAAPNAWANADRAMINEHPTPKTVVMLADAILDTTNPGEAVIDFFGGSGSTLIACQKTGRRCFMSELEPKYVQLIIRRYAKFCTDNGIEPKFEHLNGSLTLSQFYGKPELA